MKELEKNLKALANKRRLLILKHLKKIKEAPVADIAKEIKLSFKATSKHLHILCATDILEKDQRSKQVFYSLSPSLKSVVKNVIQNF